MLSKPPVQEDTGSPGGSRRRYEIAALVKGLRVLSLFTERSPALKLNEIAERTGMPVSSAFRILTTLEGQGYLERDPEGVFRPAPPVLTLGFTALQSMDLVAISTPVLRDLSAATGRSVNLGVLIRDYVLYVARLRPPGTTFMSSNLQVGSTLPAPLTAMGKVLLAYLTDEEIGARVDPSVFDGPWGPNAVRSMDDLFQRLKAVRSQGWALQQGEVISGILAIAAPIRRGEGSVAAAVCVGSDGSGRTRREDLLGCLPTLLEACRAISFRLGNVSFSRETVLHG